MASRKSKINPSSRPAHIREHVRGVLRANALECKTDGRIIGIDLSPANAGVVVLGDTGSLISRQTFSFPLPEKSREAAKLGRMLNMARRILNVVEDFKISHVAIEDYAFGKRFQAHQIGETAGTVKSQIYVRFGLVYNAISPTSARRTVLGYGGKLAKKTIRDIVKEFVEVEDDHQADAWVVAMALFVATTRGEEHGRTHSRKKKKRKNGTGKDGFGQLGLY